MRVIAYFMHEGEAAEALRMLSNVSATGSFVVGDIDESELPRLAAAGLTVDRLDADAPVETPAVARADRGLVPEGAAVGIAEGVRGEPLPREPDAPAQWVLRLGQPLLEEHRLEITARGMVLHRAVPTHAYLATATPEQAEDVLNLPFVRSVERYGPELAAPVRLAGAEEAVPGAPVTRTWDLVLDDAAARPGVREWLDRHAEERDALTVEAEGGRRLRVRLAAGSRLETAIPQLPGVMGMTEYVPPQLFNDVARVLLGVASPGGSGAGLPFTGRDQIVAVADTGLDATHPDFAGRIVDTVALGRPGDPSDRHGHGTHVAGSVLGDGSASQGAVRGVAPEARLYFQSVMDAGGGLGGLPLSLEDLFEPAYQAGARIHNNSWGAPTEAAYTANSDDVDAFVRSRPDMLVVIAAGNNGTAAVRLHSDRGFVDWLSLGSPASSKNALTVGAARTSRTDGPTAGLTWGQWHSGVPFPDSPIADEPVCGDPEALAAFSSRGPCDDWRVKPDVVAPGTDILSTRASTAPEHSFWGLHPNSRYAFMGGTSMATPLVAGCAALVREFYVRERRTRPSAALLKATLINGARTLTAADSAARDPHFHQGFGAVHLPSSLPHPGRPELSLEFVDTWETPERQFQRTGERVLFSVEAAAGTPLRVCLAYTDLPGRSLQNDLSLLMETPDGTKLAGNGGLPNRLLRTDSTNNVEAVRIPDPAPGRYLLQVFARSLLKGPQDYALVVTGDLTTPIRRVLG
ncbi:S8 family serine peptidase [Streptomyces sp. MUM 203J]|uniref:S8 family serine peptidase n=1 Tax=Streptomyces sp. MUM 203J TaxID=2791990 RepID=UPI001F04C23C|nr:S8 family serine peptidase [Streptomyces sp. MUM 203J]MCH0541890.1 S8 family serine peptidase [Streptomyces sp. MUM 203J]